MGEEQIVIDNFHALYYGSKSKQTWNGNTYWFGTRVFKYPSDLWIYQELIETTKPDLIIETGTHSGGSAKYMADMCELANHGRVVTIDIVRAPTLPKHSRISYISGSCVDPSIVQYVKTLYVDVAEKVMVVLDSDHHKEHVLKELDLWAPFVTKGCALIVEDTNINGNPVNKSHGPGPKEALDEWLPKHPEFRVSRECEKFLMTANPGGYLERV